jgi:hypothetical protein
MLEIGAFHPSWGDMHLGPENALKAHALLGGATFLPVHWATFSLAMHAWDQPAEVLLDSGSKGGARLLMPKLGQAVEPTLADGRVDPWWRTVDTVEGPAGRRGSKNSNDAHLAARLRAVEGRHILRLDFRPGTKRSPGGSK